MFTATLKITARVLKTDQCYKGEGGCSLHSQGEEQVLLSCPAGGCLPVPETLCVEPQTQHRQGASPARLLVLQRWTLMLRAQIAEHLLFALHPLPQPESFSETLSNPLPTAHFKLLNLQLWSAPFAEDYCGSAKKYGTFCIHASGSKVLKASYSLTSTS